MDYISREALLKAFRLIAKNPNKDYQRGMQDTIDCLVPEVIADVPSADVQPVKRGRWIEHEQFERKNCNVCIECSVCNKWFGHDCIPKTKFCPNCGARMDLGDEKT